MRDPRIEGFKAKVIVSPGEILIYLIIYVSYSHDPYSHVIC